MPEPIVDIKLIGADVLVQQLGSFEPRVQKKVARSALRKSAKRTKERVVRTWMRHEDTGTMADAMDATKVKAGKRSRSGIRFEWPLPIGEKKGYALGHIHNSVEYGHGNVPAKAYTRRTVNQHMDEELRAIGHDIGDGIEREAARHFRKTTGTLG